MTTIAKYWTEFFYIINFFNKPLILLLPIAIEDKITNLCEIDLSPGTVKMPFRPLVNDDTNVCFFNIFLPKMFFISANENSIEGIPIYFTFL